MDYINGLELIKDSIDQIEESYLDGIKNSLWVSDIGHLQIQLEGMLKLNDVQYIDIVHEGDTIAKKGNLQRSM